MGNKDDCSGNSENKDIFFDVPSGDSPHISKITIMRDSFLSCYGSHKIWHMYALLEHSGGTIIVEYGASPLKYLHLLQIKNGEERDAQVVTACKVSIDFQDFLKKCKSYAKGRMWAFTEHNNDAYFTTFVGTNGTLDEWLYETSAKATNCQYTVRWISKTFLNDECTALVEKSMNKESRNWEAQLFRA